MFPGRSGAITSSQDEIRSRLAELERRNQLLEAEIDRLRVFQDYAYTDVLTEVPNRRFYHDRLLQEIARSRRGSHALCLALLDLDNFKDINDRLGHRCGDQALRFFAQFVRSNLRQEDVIARIGGDEFAVLLPDTSTERALRLFERIRSRLDRLELTLDGGGSVILAFSCGISEFRTEFTPDELIEEADQALYAAKTRGRNRVVAAGPAELASSRLVH